MKLFFVFLQLFAISLLAVDRKLDSGDAKKLADEYSSQIFGDLDLNHMAWQGFSSANAPDSVKAQAMVLLFEKARKTQRVLHVSHAFQPYVKIRRKGDEPKIEMPWSAELQKVVLEIGSANPGAFSDAASIRPEPEMEALFRSYILSENPYARFWAANCIQYTADPGIHLRAFFERWADSESEKETVSLLRRMFPSETNLISAHLKGAESEKNPSGAPTRPLPSTPIDMQVESARPLVGGSSTGVRTGWIRETETIYLGIAALATGAAFAFAKRRK